MNLASDKTSVVLFTLGKIKKSLMPLIDKKVILSEFDRKLIQKFFDKEIEKKIAPLDFTAKRDADSPAANN